jgi:hypothetical protein
VKSKRPARQTVDDSEGDIELSVHIFEFT